MSNIFLKLAFRHFFKLRVYSAINVAGLALGFTAYILVSLYIHYENSWDIQNTKYNHIYRAQRHYVMDFKARDGNNISPHSRGRTAKLITERCPEVENTVVLQELKSLYISDGKGIMIHETIGCLIDSSVFDVFTYNLLEGNPKTALVAPNSIVLSKSIARKLFPNEDALGKTVVAEKKFFLKVTGVYADLPKNTHYRPNYLISMSTIENRDRVHDNLRGSYMTYVLLKPGTDVKRVNKKIYDLFNGQDKDAEQEKIVLCPMSKLYMSFNGQTAYLFVLFLYQLIGILILVLSAINYINLATANATTRIKETVVQKINGGNRYLISLQFIAESTIISVIAVGIALMLVSYLIIPFNRIIDRDIVLFTHQNIPFILKTLGITVAIGIVSGIYPAFYLIRNNITELLKGNILNKHNRFFSFRKALVGFQFMASIFLITLSIFITSQIHYLLTKNLGFAKDNILYTKFTSSEKDVNFEDFRSRLLLHPEIQNVSVSKHVPFISFGGGTVNWQGGDPGEVVNIRDNTVSYEFFETMGIPFIEGRNFSSEFPSDAADKCIVNETACKTFGWKNPIGMHLDNNRFQVIGVVKDFHFKDMHNSIEPSIFYLKKDNSEGDWTYAFRVSQHDMKAASAILTDEFSKTFPNDPFDIKLLDDGFQNEQVIQVYKSIEKTVMFFTVMLLILAAIGLLGLVAFIVRLKTKEIGVRKINGSTSSEIFILLNKELIYLVGIVAIFAWGFSYFVIRHFPGNYKQPFELWMILLGTGINVVIVLAATIKQTINAANANPVEALRYE